MSVRLVSLVTEKKPMRRPGIPQPQGSGTIAVILRTLPSVGYQPFRMDQVTRESRQWSRKQSLVLITGPLFPGTARGGGGSAAESALIPRGNSLDDGDENGGDNEADDSHQSLLRSQAVWNLVECMGSSF